MNTQIENQLGIKERNFFFIDSESLDQVASKIYGYALLDTPPHNPINTDFLHNKDIHNKMKAGGFVLVQNIDDYIFISQDYLGSWGIYFFQQGDYFAISNSFILLVDKLKDRFSLNLNEEYIKHFFVTSLVSIASDETMVKEISKLSRQSRVIINKKNRSYHIEQTVMDEGVVDLDSEQGINILDKWFFSWTNYIQYLVNNTKNVMVDLSGGMDSRVVFTLFLASGINLSRVLINSNTLKVHGYDEDFAIAQEMADYFGFTLNKSSSNTRRLQINLKDSIETYIYPKLGIHKELQFRTFVFEDGVYYFGGSGGETIRDYWHTIEDGPLKGVHNRQLQLSEDYYSYAKKIAERSFKTTKSKFNRPDNEIFSSSLLYKDTRCGYHFGRDIVQNYLTNVYRMTPLLDPMLQQIKISKDESNLLVAVILSRYCPKLLDFKFQGNRTLSNSILAKAKAINTKFRFLPQADTNQSTLQKYLVTEPIRFTRKEEIKENINPFSFMEKVFSSKYTKHVFSTYFPEEYYYYAFRYLKQHKFQPFAEASAVIATMKIINATVLKSREHFQEGFEYFASIVNSSKEDFMGKRFDHFISQFNVSGIIKCLSTARIDIKNINQDIFISNKDIFTSDVVIEALDQDGMINITQPAWFADINGLGYIVQATGGDITLKLIPKNDGELNIWLRGCDIRNNGERVQFYIDYTFLKVNNNVLIKDLVSVSHDKPFKYILKVTKDVAVTMCVKWDVHNYNKEEFAEIVRNLYLGMS